jgi:hypothetical protein
MSECSASIGTSIVELISVNELYPVSDIWRMPRIGEIIANCPFSQAQSSTSATSSSNSPAATFSNASLSESSSL